MAERSAPIPGRHLVWLSLAVLVALSAFDRSLPPLVQGLGFAHARLLEQPPVLVADNLSLAEATSLHHLFGVPVWGRHAFRVDQILLPFLAMAAALAILSRQLSALLWRALARGPSLSRFAPLAVAPAPLLAALALGAAFGLVIDQSYLPKELVLLPFVLAMLGAALYSLPACPQADRLEKALTAMSAGRWFWLGFLLVSWSDQGAREQAGAPSVVAVAVLALSFLALHWATRAPRQANLECLIGDTRRLVKTCDRLTLLTIRELWVLLPLVLLSALNAPQLRHLDRVFPAYLLSSVVCAVVMRWILQGPPASSDGRLERFTRSLVRVGTLVTIFSWPAIFVGQGVFALPILPAAVPFVIIALGLVKGRPWHSPGRASGLEPARPAPPTGGPVGPAKQGWTLRTVLAALAAAVALLIALASAGDGGRWPGPSRGESDVDRLRAGLSEVFGYRVRLVREDHRSVLLGMGLSPGERGQAERMARLRLPADQIRILEVRPWRWEGAGRFLLLLTLSATLVVVRTSLLGTVSSTYALVNAGLAGANGAFAVGASWGWFWMDPLPSVLAFALCTAVGGWVKWGDPGSRPEQLRTLPGSPPEARPEPSPGQPEHILDLLAVELFTVEVGPNLYRLAGSEPSDLPRHLAAVRRSLALELGVVVPEVRFRPNASLAPDTFAFQVRELEVARGRIPPSSEAPSRLVATALEDVIRGHAVEILSLEYVARQLDRLAACWPVTVALVKEQHSLVTLRDVYRGLLSQGVSIRDQETLLNALAGAGGSCEHLVRECRKALWRPTGGAGSPTP